MIFDWSETFEFVNLILIGGRPCIGKSTAALKLAQNISDSGKVSFIDVAQCSSAKNFEKHLFDKSESEVLIVDTLQKLTSQMAEVDDGFIIGRLKDFAKQKGCCVIVTSELSRSVEKRIGHLPSLCDLEGKVEKTDDFDLIGLVYREGYYKPLGSNETKLIFKDHNDRNMFVLCSSEQK